MRGFRCRKPAATAAIAVVTHAPHLERAPECGSTAPSRLVKARFMITASSYSYPRDFYDKHTSVSPPPVLRYRRAAMSRVTSRASSSMNALIVDSQPFWWTCDFHALHHPTRYSEPVQAPRHEATVILIVQES